MLQTDDAAVREVLDRYMEGMKSADIALLRSAFHEHASFYGPAHGGLIEAPIEGLFEWASTSLQPGATGATHRMEVDEVDIAGDVALVRCHERDFFGGDAREVFTLVRTAAGWKITSKSWTDV